MGLDVRKYVLGVSDQAMLKHPCLATEIIRTVEIMHEARSDRSYFP